MLHFGRTALAVSVVMCVGGCQDASDGFGDGAQAVRDLEINGPILNGPILNGPILNGPILNGPILNGPILNGIVFNGPILNGPILNGPILNGPILNGTLFDASVTLDGDVIEVHGADFIGTEWMLTVEQNGAPVKYLLHIDDITPSPEQPDTYLYSMRIRPESSDTWKPYCADANNNPVPAIPLRNAWNMETGDRVDEPNAITFACTNAVLAKCVLFGYRPWASAIRCDDKKNKKNCQSIGLTDYHQACTRMLRADYCGDGTPWTTEGTAIDLWDKLVPPIETPTTDWFIEAEWNPDGAYCLNDIRHQDLKELGLYPECFLKNNGKPKKIGNCGTLKKNRALITSTFDKPDDDDDDDDDDNDD